MKSKLLILSFLIPIFPSVSMGGIAVTTYDMVYTNDETDTFSDGQNFGTVQVQYWDGEGTAETQVVITVTATSNLYTDLDNFGIQAVGFNTDVTLAANQINVTADGDGLNWGVTYGQNIAGFGVFTIKNSGSGSTRGNPVVITISGLNSDGSESGLDNFALPSTGEAGNGNVYFVAHVAGFGNGAGSHWVGTDDDPDDPNNEDPPPNPVPEPASILLFGLGTLGMGAIARRRRSNGELELV